MVAYSYFGNNYSVCPVFHITNVVFYAKPLLKQTISVHFAERFYKILTNIEYNNRITSPLVKQKFPRLHQTVLL